MPALKRMPILRVLILKSNHIEKCKLKLCKSNWEHFEVLDISQNWISMSQIELEDFCKKLSFLKNMKTLNMQSDDIMQDPEAR